jgi:hypothetical protein
MGIIEFFIIVFVCCVLAFLINWALAKFAPGTPAIVPMVVWGVAVLIILVTLARAMGLMGIDPQIPRIR